MGTLGASATAAADAATLVQLELLKEFRRSREDDGSSSALDGTRGICQSISCYHQLRQRVDTAPDKLIQAYVRRMREQIGVEEMKWVHQAAIDQGNDDNCARPKKEKGSGKGQKGDKAREIT